MITVALDCAFSCQSKWSDQLEYETLQNSSFCTSLLGSQNTNKSTLFIFNEPRAHHLWVSAFFPVRRFFPLKSLPKSLSGGFSIDGLSCPKGLATCGLCMRIMAIIRSSVQVRWCVSFLLVHVTNIVCTATSLTNSTVHFFAHFLSNTYG